MKGLGMAMLCMAVFLCGACAEEKKSEEWCEAMMLKPNQAWTESEAQSFARDCLYNDE